MFKESRLLRLAYNPATRTVTPDMVPSSAVNSASKSTGINMVNHTAIPGAVPIGSNPRSAQQNATNAPAQQPIGTQGTATYGGTNLNDPSLQRSTAAANQTVPDQVVAGPPAGTSSPYLPGPTTGLDQILSGIDQKYQGMQANGQSVDPAQVAAEKQTAIAKYMADQQSAQLASQHQAQQEAQDAQGTELPRIPNTNTQVKTIGGRPAPAAKTGVATGSQMQTIAAQRGAARTAASAPTSTSGIATPPPQPSAATGAGAAPSNPAASSGAPSTSASTTALPPTPQEQAATAAASASANIGATAAMLGANGPISSDPLSYYQSVMGSLGGVYDGIASAATANKTSADAVASQIAQHQQSLLSLAQQNIEANKVGTLAYLKQQQDSQNQVLLQQKDQAVAWNAFNEQNQARLMEQQKSDNILNMAYSASITGGTFSSSANGAIQKAEMYANRDIADMHTQYGLKATDAEIAYTQAYTQLNNQFNQGVFQAMKDYRDATVDNMSKVFASDDARQTAMQKNATDLNSTLKDLAVSKASNITSAAGKAADIMVSQNQLTYQKQNAALDRLSNLALNILPTGGQPSQAVMDEAAAARNLGIPESVIAPFLTGETSVRSLMPMFNYQGMQATNPNNYTDPVQQQQVNYLNRIDAGVPQEQKGSDGISLQQAYQAGGQPAANQLLVKMAINKLNPDDSKAVSADADVVSQVQRVQDFIGAHADDLKSQGIVTFNYENMLKYAGQSKDPAYLQFAQDIGMLNADELHRTYGARLTETELGFATGFLPQIQNEPIGDINNKLSGLKDHMQNALNGIFDRSFGASNIYTPPDGGSTGSSSSAPSAPDANAPDPKKDMNGYLKYEQQKIYGNGGAGGGNIDNGPIGLSSLGTVTQHFDTPVSYTASGLHHAVDIANKEGTPVPSLTAGTITDISNTGDLGNHITIRTPDGHAITYAHFDALPSLQNGQTITQGQIIAPMGHTGLTSRDLAKGKTGDHVHIQVQDPKGNFIDPEKFFPSYIASR